MRSTRLIDQLDQIKVAGGPSNAPAAARVRDMHSCPKVRVIIPHLGGPILPPCDPTTLVNGRAQARATDNADCIGPNDLIVTGSDWVRYQGLPAARVGSKTMHGGKVLPPCSPDVFIGGPEVGVLVGDPHEAAGECWDMAKGRADNSVTQSYSNCGVESARMIVNHATDASVTEDAMFDLATSKGWAKSVVDPATKKMDRFKSGGTPDKGRQSILGAYGVSSTSMSQNMASIEQAVAEGKGIISIHKVGVLWKTTQEGTHAVNTTGIRYGPDGKPQSVYVADTSGNGRQGCLTELPVDRYEKSLSSYWKMNVTDGPVWK
jgi:uncharacterized Zn-binding protein involved in type VI secretion